MKVTKSPVHSISETLSLEVRTPLTLKNNQEEYEYLKDIDADIEEIKNNTSEMVKDLVKKK